MPANIAQDDKGALFISVGEPAWWDGAGKYVVPRNLTPKQAMKLTRTGWRTVKAPAYAKVGSRYIESPDFVALTRDDTHQVLAFVSPDYQPEDNAGAIDMAYAIAGAAAAGKRRKAAISTLGALGTGSRLFVTIDLSALVNMKVKRDPSRNEPYLIGQWGHDGATALRYSLWNRRVVCENTSRMADAYGESSGCLVRIVHTGDMTEKVREAQRVLGFAERVAVAHVERMNALNSIALPSNGKFTKWLAEFTEKLVPIPEGMDRTVARIEARAMIANLVRSSRTLEGVPNSPYRVYQAVCEYADHYRPVRVKDANLIPERKVISALGGAAADVKDRALDMLLAEFAPQLAELGKVLVPVK
jgi:phage/plasmid-like protein (TIGR03299 family)